MEFHENVSSNIPLFQFSIIPFFPAKSEKKLRASWKIWQVSFEGLFFSWHSHQNCV